MRVTNLNEYQKLAQRTSSTSTARAKIENGCLGLAGESGEVCDILKKHLFQGHGLDGDSVIDELGGCALVYLRTGGGVEYDA